MRLEFVIDRDDLSPERIAEYTRLLNIMLGIDGEWQSVPQRGTADERRCRYPDCTCYAVQGQQRCTRT